MASYDYVIIGAGSAGCVLANRLSAGGATVLLLEAGGSDRKIQVKAPAAFPQQFRTQLDWCLVSEPEPGLFGRRLMLPRGKMLGGSSSMNAMFYVRGNAADYDDWATKYGAEGWSYAEVLPYFKRVEDNQELHDEYHGRGGEVYVSQKRWLSPHPEAFMRAAEQAGLPRNPDYNGASQDGVSQIQTTTKRGRRWSAVDAFLRPVMKRENLTIITGALVRRITLDSSLRATGVEYARGDRAEHAAGGEIVLCAGAYGSPQLLMLSGIGPAEHLAEHGITTVLDQPAVGANLHDHPFALLNWRCNDPRTLDDGAHPKYAAQWLATRRGKLTSVVGEGVAHWRSQPGLNAPDFQIYFAPAMFWEHGVWNPDGPYITLGVSLQAPESRGSVRLRSNDPAAAPRILNNLLSEESDVTAMLRGIDKALEIAGNSPLSELLAERINPGETVADLTSWLRATCEHIYHPAGTCRIGPEGEGVLDPQLKVRGVSGLRVADAAAMPRVTRGNTNAPVYMIAERCAEFMLAGR